MLAHLTLFLFETESKDEAHATENPFVCSEERAVAQREELLGPRAAPLRLGAGSRKPRNLRAASSARAAPADPVSPAGAASRGAGPTTGEAWSSGRKSCVRGARGAGQGERCVAGREVVRARKVWRTAARPSARVQRRAYMRIHGRMRPRTVPLHTSSESMLSSHVMPSLRASSMAYCTLSICRTCTCRRPTGERWGASEPTTSSLTDDHRQGCGCGARSGCWCGCAIRPPCHVCPCGPPTRAGVPNGQAGRHRER